MAECNKQAVEDVKRNIESQIASLQKEIDSMNQTISRLSSCNGTKENPHNHSSEIGSLRSQISANQSTIEQLFSLLKAVMDAKTTMEEADRKLRELVEAYQQGKTERMKLTSAILYDEMKILEEEYKAGIINSYEYEGTLVHLKEQYIETLQSEIDMHKERIKHISGSSSEYDKIQKEINDKTKELISFVDSNDMIYPKSLDEKRADGLKTEIAELEQILFTAEGSGVKRTKIRLEEKKSELKHIEKDIMNDIFYVAQISKEMNSPKVCNQIYDRLSPLAVSYGTEKIVNDCIDYKLNDVEGKTREEKLWNYFAEHKLTLAEEYLCRTNPDDLDKGRINLHWITENDLFNKPMPEWWLEEIEIPENLAVDESNYNEMAKASKENALFEFYKETYMIADLAASSPEESLLYSLDVNNVSENIMYEEWFDLNYGHLNPNGSDKRRQKYLLEKLDLGTYREKHGIYIVYTDDITSEFENATLLYLNMYEHYDEYYTGLLSALSEETTSILYVGIMKIGKYLAESINSDKQITNWLNKDIKNKKPISYEDRELVDGIIAGKYLQVDETIMTLNNEYAEVLIDENGNAVIKNWVYGEKYPNGYICHNYNFNAGITNFANQRYVQADEFMLELDRYIDYKISNNIYTEQESGFKADELERQFLKECPEEYKEIRERLRSKAEELRLNGIPDEQNAALKELERQTNTLRNYLLGIEDRKALQQFSRVRDVDVAVEIGKGVIDAGALAAGLVLTGPTGLFVGLGIDSLAIGLCVEHGDDEEAVFRTVGVIAGMGAGAVVKYADEVADLGDDVLGSVYKKKLDIGHDFKGFNLDGDFESLRYVETWENYMSLEDAVRYKDWNVQKIREISIKNPNSDSMTLGKYLDGTIDSGSYIAKAKSTGDTYFDLGDQFWNDVKKAYNLNDDEMFDLFNKYAIDDAVKKGKRIRFSQNPKDYKTSYLYQEWEYLQNNYGYSELNFKGEYWYAE